MAVGNQKLSGEDYQGALEQFAQIVAIDEDFNEGQALFSQAECQWKLSQRDDAIKSYKRVIELHPDSELAKQAGKRLEEAGSKEDNT